MISRAIQRLPVSYDQPSNLRTCRARVTFLTPTELKGAGKIALEPDFDLLVRRLLERVRSIGQFYQGWVDIPNGGWLKDLAQAVRRQTSSGTISTFGGAVPAPARFILLEASPDAPSMKVR